MGEDFTQDKGIMKKKQKTSEFIKTYSTIWFTHNWKNITFQQFNDRKCSSNLCRNKLESKRKEQHFRNYNSASTFSWVPSNWILLESSKRIPKEWEWTFQCLKNAWESLPSTFFFQNCQKKALEIKWKIQNYSNMKKHDEHGVK